MNKMFKAAVVFILVVIAFITLTIVVNAKDSDAKELANNVIDIAYDVTEELNGEV